MLPTMFVTYATTTNASTYSDDTEDNIIGGAAIEAVTDAVAMAVADTITTFAASSPSFERKSPKPDAQPGQLRLGWSHCCQFACRPCGSDPDTGH